MNTYGKVICGGEGMADYSEWNSVIVSYFLQGLPTGTTVYLSMDLGALSEISTRLNIDRNDEEPWKDDFYAAIRSECVRQGNVYLRTIDGIDESGIPHGVAFLGAMVLAACLMMDEETEDGIISETNYFNRLRTVLGLDSEERGRPSGLNPPGVEEKLWKQWNDYLLRNRFFPSAEAGQGIAHKYINYPLSQALLRNADHERLERVFRKEQKAGRLSQSLDMDRLNVWLKNNSHLITSSHLKDLFNQDDRRRYNALCESVYEVYTQIEWDKEMIDNDFRSGLERQRRLTAGLYRVEDPFTEQIEYLLYPQQPRRCQASELQVTYEEQNYNLDIERSGWFYPLWPINPVGGLIYPVIGDPRFFELMVPDKGFWILIRDHENEDSGVFASWGYPDLGETFLLVCRQEYKDQLDLLAQENLMRWDHTVELSDKLEGWVEYRECMVTSDNWDCIIPVNADLFEALRPNVRASISLKNGLRIPPHLRWLEGYGPELTVIGFTDSCRLQITVLGDDIYSVRDELVETNRSIALHDLSAGSYLIKIYEGSRVVSMKSFQIVLWQELEPQMMEIGMGINLGVCTLEGALIRTNE